MTNNLQLYKSRWSLKLFLYILLTISIVLLSPHMVSAQTALTFYGQNDYQKQIKNFSNDIKIMRSYGSYISVVTNDNVIHSGNYVAQDPENINETIITDIPNIEDIRIPTEGVGIALTENGDVWAWGDNENSTLPRKLNELPVIKSIDINYKSFYALDFEGNVWGWGNNWHGSLGSLGVCPNGQPTCGGSGNPEAQNYVTSPTIIPGFASIDSIDAGSPGLTAKDTSGQYFILGTICDIEASWDKYITPYLYTGVSNIQNVIADACSIHALTASGEVYQWGFPGLNQGSMPQPKLMNNTYGPVKKIYTDEGYTNLALTQQNNIYYYEYFGYPWESPTELFVGHLVDESIQLLPMQIYDSNEADPTIYGYIAASNPESSDTIPPTVTGIPDRLANGFGWYNADVTVNWASNDPDPSSGFPNTPAPVLANIEGLNTYTSGQSCDPAGNCATGSIQLSIDKTLPTSSFSGNALILRFLGRTISGSAADNISGIQSVVLSSGSTSLSNQDGGISLSCAGSNCSWSANRNRLTSGLRNYNLIVTDFAGNTTSINRYFIVI